jgi:serine/threonine protein kinase
VYRQSDGEKCVVKRVREDSDELEILNKLSSTGATHKHIIPLLDSFYTSSGSWWIILPELTPVCNYDLRKIPARVEGFCEGVIAGLAHLHGLYIAHRDVKPENVVIDSSFVAKIIDFDLALELGDIDEEVDDYCGTDDWVAPEIEEEGGRPSYSPIRADQWACGKVVLSFLDEAAKEGGGLRIFAEQLMAWEPTTRPSLHEWSQQTFDDTLTRPTRRLHLPDASEPSAVKKRRLNSNQPRFNRNHHDEPAQ